MYFVKDVSLKILYNYYVVCNRVSLGKKRIFAFTSIIFWLGFNTEIFLMPVIRILPLNSNQSVEKVSCCLNTTQL